MEAKFDIQYLIGRKEKKALKRIKGSAQYKKTFSPDGWILITIGDYEYGFLQVDDSVDGFELLDEWFNSFKEVYIKLHSSSMVILDYWEEPTEYFLFKRKDGNVCIQYFEKTFPPSNDGQVIATKVYGIKLVAETVVPEERFFNTIQTKVNEFWMEVGSLNPILKDYVEQFKI